MTKKTIAIILLLSSILNLRAQKLSDNYNYKIDLQYNERPNLFIGNLALKLILPNDVEILPFDFIYDNSNKQLLKARINGNDTHVDFTNTGFKIDINTDIKISDSLKVIIEFQTTSEIIYSDGVLCSSIDIPMLQFFENDSFIPNYQKHSNYDVRITAPEKYEVITSGIESNKTCSNQNQIIEIQINDTPSFGIYLAQGLARLDTLINNSIQLQSYYKQSDTIWSKLFHEYAIDIIKFYTDKFGFYPQSKLVILPGSSNIGSGCPVAPNIIMIYRGDNIVVNDSTENRGMWITAHEIGHQYWGYNYVLMPIKLPQWFGLSMGIYSDWLYSNNNGLNLYQYKDWTDMYISSVLNNENTQILGDNRATSKDNSDYSNIIEHGKPFIILKLLTYEIGTENFSKIIDYFLNNYKGVNATLNSFWKVCEQISDKELDWFFNQWYLSNSHLEYQIKNVSDIKMDNKYISKFEIEKIGDAGASNIKIQCILDNGDLINKDFNGRLQKNIISFETENMIEKVIIDPDNQYPLINKKTWIKPN